MTGAAPPASSTRWLATNWQMAPSWCASPRTRARRYGPGSLPRTAAAVTSTAPAGCDPDGFATGTADADVNTVTPNGGRPAGKRPGSAPAGRAVELPRASEAGASEVLRLRGATSAVVTPGGSGGPPAYVDEFVALGQPGLAAGVGRRS